MVDVGHGSSSFFVRVLLRHPNHFIGGGNPYYEIVVTELEDGTERQRRVTGTIKGLDSGEVLECDGRTFYPSCTGPHFVGADQATLEECQNEADDDEGGSGYAIALMFLLFILGIILFILDKLKSGYHDQHMGLYRSRTRPRPYQSNLRSLYVGLQYEGVCFS